MRKRGLVAVVTLVTALVCTVGIGMANKKESNACNYFKRVSVKKCAVTLSQTEFNWNGEAQQPDVTVNYQGEDLEQGVDFVVEYSNNVDAGKATVTVKGKGDYRNKQKVDFNIRGLDISKDCEIKVANGEVEIYFEGQKLPEGYYSVNVLKMEELINTIPGPNGALNTYKVIRTYSIKGKGAFEGSTYKKDETTEMRYEDNGTF